MKIATIVALMTLSATAAFAELACTAPAEGAAARV